MSSSRKIESLSGSGLVLDMRALLSSKTYLMAIFWAAAVAARAKATVAAKNFMANREKESVVGVGRRGCGDEG